MPRKSRFSLPALDLGQETVGQRLARLRKQRGLSQVQLAEKIGIIQSIISAYERDTCRLNADMLARIALTLDVSADELLGLKRRQPPRERPSLTIIRRLERIEQLPLAQRKLLLRTIDTLIRGAAGHA